MNNFYFKQFPLNFESLSLGLRPELLQVETALQLGHF
jgi:hypothetical protein